MSHKAQREFLWTVVPGGLLNQPTGYEAPEWDTNSYLSMVCLECYNRQTIPVPLPFDPHEQVRLQSDLMENHVCGHFNQFEHDEIEGRASRKSEWVVG